MLILVPSIFFFFNATATTEIYTLSLHDALPISPETGVSPRPTLITYSDRVAHVSVVIPMPTDRKSTRLNSSHVRISYAVFCLKKKNHQYNTLQSANPDPRSPTLTTAPSHQATRD